MNPTNGATVSGSQGMSDILNSYFSSVFTSENVVDRDSLIIGSSPCSISDIVCTPELVKGKLNMVLNMVKHQALMLFILLF